MARADAEAKRRLGLEESHRPPRSVLPRSTQTRRTQTPNSRKLADERDAARRQRDETSDRLESSEQTADGYRVQLSALDSRVSSRRNEPDFSPSRQASEKSWRQLPRGRRISAWRRPSRENDIKARTEDAARLSLAVDAATESAREFESAATDLGRELTQPRMAHVEATGQAIRGDGRQCFNPHRAEGAG